MFNQLKEVSKVTFFNVIRNNVTLQLCRAFRQSMQKSQQTIRTSCFSPLNMHHCACIKYFILKLLFQASYMSQNCLPYIYIQAICYIYQDMSVRIDFTEGYSFMGRGGHGKDNHGPQSNMVYICIIMDVSSNICYE